MSNEAEPRFWVDSPVQPESSHHKVEGWMPVTDDERGGVVAYFGREEDAKEYAQFLEWKYGKYIGVHTLGGVIQQLLRGEDYDAPCTHILWVGDDVRDVAKDMTDDEVENVLYQMEEGKDCSIGQSWETVRLYVDYVRDERCDTCGWAGEPCPEELRPDTAVECPTCHLVRPTYQSDEGTQGFVSQKDALGEDDD